MLRVSLLLIALFAIGCPDPEVVGHAPKAQVDQARERINAAAKAEAKKMEQALPPTD
jgi:hypothetical protein